MYSAAAYRFSHRINQLIGQVLCICIIASTLVSAAATAGTMRMAVNLPAITSTDSSTQLHTAIHSDMTEELSSHDAANLKKADHQSPNTHAHHAQHAPCENVDHPGKADCQETCTVNLCCTAAGLLGFFNSLQLNAPKLTQRYPNHDSSQCLTPQPSLVLRPPIA